MRFASLGSGSRGNATVVAHGRTLLLVDCGFSAREAARRLGRLGLEPAQLSAILVTHEHDDHVGGVVRLARKHGITVYATAGTRRGHDFGETAVVEFSSHQPFVVGDLEITPFPVPHDAREPCQFVFSDGGRRLGMLTDVGRSTPHLEAQLAGCNALLIEANHDPQMLAQGPYPPSLKARVGGGQGHLSNQQAAAVLRGIDCSQLSHLVAAHLSEKNNTPELARTALAAALGCANEWIAVADQAHGCDWREIA